MRYLPRLPRVHYRRSRVLLTAVVIMLLVPASVLSVRSVWISLASAEELQVEKEKKVEEKRVERRKEGPFAYTAAAEYAEGESGITTKAVAPVGEIPTEQVEAALVLTRQTLLLARSDDRTLSGDTQPYTEKFAQSAQQFVKDQLAQPGLGYVTRLAPGYTLSAPPRVKGSLSFEEGEQGELVLRADVFWVYAVEGETPVASPSPSPDVEEPAGARLVLLRSTEKYQWYPESGYLPEDRGLRPSDGTVRVFNMDCEFSKQGLLALPKDTVKKKDGPRVSDFLDAEQDIPSSC